MSVLVGIVSVCIVAYTTLFRQQLFFGIVVALTIAVPYRVWRRDDHERAGVLLVLGVVLSASAWTAQLLIFLPTLVICALAYDIWLRTGIRHENAQ